QRLARLRAGIVELAGLADDDGSRTDDEDAVDVGSFRHLRLLAFRGLLLDRIASARIRLDALDHQVHEMLEQKPQIMWAGAGLGMALKAEGRPVGVRHAL